jgi:hypothetical protein
MPMHDIRNIGLVNYVNRDLLAFRHPNQLAGNLAIKCRRVDNFSRRDLKMQRSNANGVVRGL